MQPIDLELRGVSLEFSAPRRGRLEVLTDVTLRVHREEFVCVIGLSGCGKSSLLNLIAGFIQPTKGEVMFKGQRIAGPSSDRVMVFQEDAVFPWMTVRENVAYGPRTRGASAATAEGIAERYIDQVGLRQFSDYFPKNLSGGMRKRVDLARAYAASPSVLLMDEPFGSLDAHTREQMQLELLSLWERERKTVLFVTHDLAESLMLADRVVVLSRSPGSVLALHEVSFPRPRDRHLRRAPEFLALLGRLEAMLRSTEVHS